tara:strand:- start:306 stop:851 length:546 start_codon:yes stop_codon:yes gene_type:complete
MALTRLGGANAISGTIPATNVANATLNNITALPAAVKTGKILQVVTANDNTNTSNTSSSTYVAATDVDISITPTSTSSKIFVEFNVCVYQTLESGAKDSSFQYELYRDSTLIYTNGSLQYYTSAGWSGNVRYMRYFSRIDTPSSTSAINYNFKFRNPHNSGSIQINQGSQYSDMRAMEIAG